MNDPRQTSLTDDIPPPPPPPKPPRARLTVAARAKRNAEAARLNLSETATEQYRRCDGFNEIYRPLLDWTLDDVWAIHRRHRLKPNPLYRQGASRVGCAPCIYARKGEIKMLAERYPEEIARIAEWETILNRIQKTALPGSTYFNARDLAKRAGEPIDWRKHGIRAQVDWARGGAGADRQTDIPADCTAPGICE